MRRVPTGRLLSAEGGGPPNPLQHTTPSPSRPVTSTRFFIKTTFAAAASFEQTPVVRILGPYGGPGARAPGPPYGPRMRTTGVCSNDAAAANVVFIKKRVEVTGREGEGVVCWRGLGGPPPSALNKRPVGTRLKRLRDGALAAAARRDRGGAARKRNQLSQ